MHTNFADWYRMLSVDLSQVPLDARWQGVEAATETITKSTALELVRSLFEKPSKNAEFDAEFRSSFRNSDSAFPMRDNNLEMQVLAAAVITEVLAADDVEIGDVTALAVSCADFQGIHPKILLSEIVNHCENYLHERSCELRKSKIPVSIEPLAKSPDLVEVAKSQPDTNVIWSAIQPTIEKLELAPNKLVKSINDAFSILVETMNLQQEESNMLWWLFSASSRDLKLKMSDLGLAASLVAGKELADLTQILPGPVAAEAFLDRILDSADQKKATLTLRDALNTELVKDWKTKSTSQLNLDICDDICTVHYAIRQSANSDNDVEWMPSFAKRAGLSADDQISRVTLATQAYRERLLMKAMN